MTTPPTATAQKMQSVWIDVTPEMAKAWLAKNTGNRGVRTGTVKLYARIMTEGHWRVTHQGVSLDEDGVILDGQHRLAAIARSGVTVRLLVTFNQPRSNMRVLDRGRGRTVADTLRIFHNMSNPTQRAATARIVISIRNGVLSGSYEPDVDEIELEVLEHGDHYNWIFEAVAGHKKWNSLVYGALAYAYPTAPAKVREFTQLVIEPANVPAGSIIFKAQEVINAGGRGRAGADRMQVFRRVLRCIQAYVRGETLKQVKDTTEGLRYFAKLRGDTEALSASEEA